MGLLLRSELSFLSGGLGLQNYTYREKEVKMETQSMVLSVLCLKQKNQAFISFLYNGTVKDVTHLRYC